MRFLYIFVWTFVQSFPTEEWWLLTPSRPSSCISVPRVLSFQPAVFSPFLGPIPILLNSMSELRFPLISAILKQNNKKYWPTLAALFCPFIYLINYCSRNHTMSIVLCPLISAILKQNNKKYWPTLAALFCPFIYLINYCSRNHTMSIVLCPLISTILQKNTTTTSLHWLLLCPFISTILQQKPHNEHRVTLAALLCPFLEIWTMLVLWNSVTDSPYLVPGDCVCVYCVCVCVHTCMCVCVCHGSPVSAISYSLVDRLTPIALSLTPGHAWHSSVASGTSGNWAFFVITCACRSCSILWQFQSHAVAKPGFLTAWMLVCLLVQSLLF